MTTNFNELDEETLRSMLKNEVVCRPQTRRMKKEIELAVFIKTEAVEETPAIPETPPAPKTPKTPAAPEIPDKFEYASDDDGTTDADDTFEFVYTTAEPVRQTFNVVWSPVISPEGELIGYGDLDTFLPC